MADENLAFLLDEVKAYWVKESSVLGLLPDGTLVREWRNIPIAHRAACLANLAARRIETAPKSNTEAYAGVYRILRIEDIIANDAAGRAHSVTIREYLAKGLATTLTDATQVVRVGGEVRVPGTATTWPVSPAHPGGTSAIQQDSRAVTLRWVNLDPKKLEAINTERTDVTLATMTVNAETLTGPWYNIARNSGQTDDGSGFYEEVWSLAEFALEAVEKTGDMQVVSNRFIQGVPKNRVKTVLDAEIAAMTTYGTAGYTHRQKIYWRDNTADIITESVEVKEKSDSNTSETRKAGTSVRTIYKNTASIPDAETAAQGITDQVRGDINSDGKFDYTKETTTAVKQEVALHNSEVNAAKTEQTKSGKNLYDADLSGYVVTAAAGYTKRRSHTVNPDGTYDDVVSTVASIDQTGSTDGTHSDQHFDTADKTEDTEVHTAAAAPLADVAFATQGTVVETQNSPNEDGTFRTSAKTVVSKEQQINNAVVTEEKFRQVVTDIGKNIKDSTLGTTYPVAATTGEIVKRSLSKNQDDTFDVARDRDVAKTVASAETSSEISLFETVTTDIDRNNTAADTPPASQTPGTIIKVVNKINDYNRVDVAVETRTAAEITEASKETKATAFETVAAVTDRNEAAAETPIASQTAGTIKTVVAKKNDYGKFDNVLETRTALAVSTAEKQTSATAFETDSRITDRNQVAAATPITTQTPGTIVTAKADLNDFGKYDNVVDTKTAVYATTTVNTSSDKFESAATVIKRNADAVESAAGGGSGTILRASSRLNDFGKYDSEKETITPASVEDSGNFATKEGTVYWWKGTNVSSGAYSSAISTAALDSSTNNSVTKTINRFGLIDYFIIKQPYNGAVFSWVIGVGTGTEIEREHQKIYKSADGRDVYCRRDVTYSFSWAIRNSYIDAKTYIDGGLQNSRIESHGNGRYYCIKVTSITAAGWTSDEVFA